MSTTGLSALPSSLAALLTQYHSGGTAPSSSSATSGRVQDSPLALGSDPAYSLTLGQQDASKALVGYNQLGKLGKTFETEVAALEKPTLTTSGTGGSVNVQVHQLAQAQSVVAGPFGDPDTVSLGTGTLSIETGTTDATTGSFTANGQPVSIAITNGSLNDIANSINAAQAGLSASVMEENGGYTLHLIGNTGADQSFRISGLSELAYDPAQPESSPLATTQTAQDALYSADGIELSSGTNTSVPVALGTRADFTATGSMSVTKSALPDAVQKLVDAFNSMQKGIAGMAGKDGNLTNDVNLAAGLFKNLGDAATGTFGNAGSVSQLSDIGVTVQSDGTLAIDPTAMDAAVAADASGVQSLIGQVSTAMADAVTPYTKSGGALSSQVSLLSTLALHHGSSLLDYLDGSAGSQSSSGLLGALNANQSASSSGQKTLLDYLNSTSSSSSSSSSSDLSSLFSTSG